MTSRNLIRPFVRDLIDDLQEPTILWQIAAMLLCLLLAYVISRYLQRKLISKNAAGETVWSVGLIGRLAFPLVACGALSITEQILQEFQSANLLKLVLTLMIAMVAIRFFVYALRRGFSKSSFLATFERGMEIIVWAGVALYLSNMADDLQKLLSSIYLPIGKTHLNLFVLLQGLLSVGVTMLFALWLGAAIESRLMAVSQVDSSLRAVLARISRALILVLALMIGLSLTGIDLTVLSVFSGALGVGLGLGMQKIASNYISGFILLLDRSLRLGDVVAVDKYHGTVAQIRTRYTVIRASDGTEAFLPNEMLVNSPVNSFASSDKKFKVVNRVRIEYGSDVDLAMRLLVDSTENMARVLAEPAPSAFLVEFADEGMVLELNCWIADAEKSFVDLQSHINLNILDKFAVAGLKMPAKKC
ncbi:MAG: mechanosensitive ion channel family protein [Burkholderiaceae bacterium]|jgi:small-conductance mechanosensitive channel